MRFIVMLLGIISLLLSVNMEFELDMEVIDYQNRIVNVPRNILARRRNNFDELNDTKFHLQF